VFFPEFVGRQNLVRLPQAIAAGCYCLDPPTSPEGSVNWLMPHQQAAGVFAAVFTLPDRFAFCRALRFLDS
jgi:hypothetical protein